MRRDINNVRMSPSLFAFLSQTTLLSNSFQDSAPLRTWTWMHGELLVLAFDVTVHIKLDGRLKVTLITREQLDAFGQLPVEIILMM